LKYKLPILVACSLASVSCFGQSGAGSTSFVGILLIVAALVAVFVLLLIADSIMRVEAKSQGLEDKEEQFSLMPSLASIFSKKKPDHLVGKPVHMLSAGHDIVLEGAPENKMLASDVTTYAVQPSNFRGIFPIPKLHVEVGDDVKAGDPLFYNKSTEHIKYVAPVSGEIVEINRGAKRSIAEVVILADKEQRFTELPALDYTKAERSELVAFLQTHGAWPLLRQRPYDIVADTEETPRDIFISTFDSAPAAPDSSFLIQGREKDFQAGINVLARLTDGKVYLGAKADEAVSSVFTDAQNAEVHFFGGSHPIGNVGTQIHHIKPIGRDGVVWTLGVQEVMTIGSLFTQRKYDASRVVAVTGPCVADAGYIKTYIGARVGDLIKGNLQEGCDNVRLISGDVLSGQEKSAEEYLNFHDDQVTVLEEGDSYELFGWLSPFAVKPSVSPMVPSSIFSDVALAPNTNTNGERRAFVITGQYEKVMPMDILLQHLMKATMANDIERMEGLGILEIIEEDVALPEFVCTSKMPLQEILRDGLDYMREQD